VPWTLLAAKSKPTADAAAAAQHTRAQPCGAFVAADKASAAAACASADPAQTLTRLMGQETAFPIRSNCRIRRADIVAPTAHPSCTSCRSLAG